ncbi:MAG: ATP cone domain-containing protein, partial [Eubacteriales bacterium]
MSSHNLKEIIKRSGRAEPYDGQKILGAIRKVFIATGTDITEESLTALLNRVEMLIEAEGQPLTVEFVQDMAERALMEAGHFTQAKSYILYRDTRRKKRADRQAIMAHFQDFDELTDVLLRTEKDYRQEEYDLGILQRKFMSLYKEEASGLDERVNLLIRSAIELTDK